MTERTDAPQSLSYIDYGDAFDFWWNGNATMRAQTNDVKWIAWNAWKASAARSEIATPHPDVRRFAVWHGNRNCLHENGIDPLPTYSLDAWRAEIDKLDSDYYGPLNAKPAAPCVGLPFVVEYDRKPEHGLMGWTPMAAFDYEAPAEDYAKSCAQGDVPWRYRVVNRGDERPEKDNKENP